MLYNSSFERPRQGVHKWLRGPVGTQVSEAHPAAPVMRLNTYCSCLELDPKD